jgi:hypothetical protein
VDTNELVDLNHRNQLKVVKTWLSAISGDKYGQPCEYRTENLMVVQVSGPEIE